MRTSGCHDKCDFKELKRISEIYLHLQSTLEYLLPLLNFQTICIREKPTLDLLEGLTLLILNVYPSLYI